MCLNGWQRIGIAASVVWAIGAPIFQSVSCGRNVAFDNLCVIENELQAAMTNPCFAVSLISSALRCTALRPHCVSSHRDHASGPPDLATISNAATAA